VSRTVDVFVVGAGTAGAAVARACARRGLATVVIDKGPLGQAGARWINGVPGHVFDAANVPRPTGPELAAEGHPFHMVAGYGPGKVSIPPGDLLEVDMRFLVARLQADARAAGARLLGEETAEAWEPDAEGATVRTSHGTWRARWVVDASGLKGAPFAPPSAVPRTEICVAAQEVREVVDATAARRFFEDHGVQPGDTLCFTGVSGGYSIINVRYDPAENTLAILTGGIPGLGHQSGVSLIEDFVGKHSWVGPKQFGGSRAIPLLAPLARPDLGPMVRVGDAARQVFAAHGSGIGAQLIAADHLATTLADGGTLRDYAVQWQRTWGGHFCGSVAFARFSRGLTPEDLRDLFASGLMAPSVASRTLHQKRAGLGRTDLPNLPRMLLGAVKAPHWLARLAPIAGLMARLELHHSRYPRDPKRVDDWAEVRDQLLARAILPSA
jgi:flavin-dependent dehydrogenase